MNPEATTKAARVYVEFSPAWQFIDDVRRFAERFCRNARLSDVERSGVEVAVHEMLQNALAYSVDGWASLDVQIDLAEKQLRIEVRSRSRPEHLERLGQIVARMKGEPDPLKHYLALMRETAERSEGSGLGLARIRHEAEMQVEVEIRDGEVRVTATRAIGEHTGGQA